MALGLALRVWNAASAVHHEDETVHAAGDGAWLTLGVARGYRFLYDHPRDHFRLDPRTGALERWGMRENEVARLGHPGLFALVMGVPLAVLEPASSSGAVLVGRVVNALADTSTIALLPALVRGLGGSPGGGLLAAGLYAVFPPAVTYGSIATLDPFQAPLLVLLLLALVHPGTGPGPWLRAGVATGLFLAAKQTGLIALVLVPLIGVFIPPRNLRGLVVWAVTGFAVLALFANPAAYVDSIFRPSHPFGELTFDPLTRIRGNLSFILRPSTYYWLSFARHAEPLAPALARVHRVLTPAYLVAFGAALAVAVARGHGKRLLFLVVPAVLTLAFVEPTDGIWRFHLLFPLFCTLVACELVPLAWPWRAGVALAAAIAAVTPLLPLRPGSFGLLDLGELVFMNPQARQLPGYFSIWKGHPLFLTLKPGMEIHRRLWLPPGRYDVALIGTGAPEVSVDGQPALSPDAPPARDAQGALVGTVEVTGHVHRLIIAIPEGGLVSSVALRRRP